MFSMCSTHPFGKPVNVLKFGRENKIIVDNAQLENILLHPDVKDRKIVMFSIIGAFRQGKSFFLDCCLRFLYAKYSSINNPNNTPVANWMGAAEEPLKGFSWKSGIERDTTGVVMWSDVFLHTVETTGEKIAIVVIDTQGLFDNKTSPADNSRIFALGTLISSIQILNIERQIQEDQLEYLQFATEFANFVAQDQGVKSVKPFQNLFFLIRDWQNPEEMEFGMIGGKYYLMNVLQTTSELKPELNSVRKFIKASFEQVNCCLMPYPGKDVASKKDYDGQWKLMDEEFKDQLVIVIEKLLGSENLVLKKINGKDLKAFELKQYMETYFTLFESDKLPQAQSIYESTIDKQMNILMAMCLDSYNQNIAENQHLLEEGNLHMIHEISEKKALTLFKDEKKMGNDEHESKYRPQLEEQISKLYVEWKDRSLKHLQQLREEKEKTEAANQEKIRLEQEALEAERIAAVQQAELDRQKEIQIIENLKHDAEKKAMDRSLEVEKERARAIEAERDAEKERSKAAEAERDAEKERVKAVEAKRDAVEAERDAERKRAEEAEDKSAKMARDLESRRYVGGPFSTLLGPLGTVFDLLLPNIR